MTCSWWMHFITLCYCFTWLVPAYRKFGVKCSRCGDRLLPGAEVMRVQSHVFHLQCFVCVVCCQPLVKGAEFVLRSGQLFCKQEFEKELYMMQQASPSGTIITKYSISLISSLNVCVVWQVCYRIFAINIFLVNFLLFKLQSIMTQILACVHCEHKAEWSHYWLYSKYSKFQ
jgi:hypothetical protein